MTAISEDGAMPEAGDVVLFSGKGWSSDIVRIFTRSCWSHVGVVIRDPAHDAPLLLEATTEPDVADVRAGRPVAGVSLVPLAQKLNCYQGEVVWRRCLSDEDVRVRRLKVLDAAQEFIHRPYCNYVTSWFYRRVQATPRGVFCSELVAEIYRRAGWLPPDFTAARAVPAHFAGQGLPLRQVMLAEPLDCRSSVALSRADDAVLA